MNKISINDHVCMLITRNTFSFKYNLCTLYASILPTTFEWTHFLYLWFQELYSSNTLHQLKPSVVLVMNSTRSCTNPRFQVTANKHNRKQTHDNTCMTNFWDILSENNQIYIINTIDVDLITSKSAVKTLYNLVSNSKTL